MPPALHRSVKTKLASEISRGRFLPAPAWFWNKFRPTEANLTSCWGPARTIKLLPLPGRSILHLPHWQPTSETCAPPPAGIDEWQPRRHCNFSRTLSGNHYRLGSDLFSRGSRKLRILRCRLRALRPAGPFYDE